MLEFRLAQRELVGILFGCPSTCCLLKNCLERAEGALVWACYHYPSDRETTLSQRTLLM